MKYAAAVRLADESVIKAQVERHLRPPKIEIDGIKRYWRYQEGEALDQSGWLGPTPRDVVAAADALLPHIRSLRAAKLKPTNVVVPDWQRRWAPQQARYEEFRAAISEVQGLVERVREDADIVLVEWQTVANADYHIRLLTGWAAADHRLPVA
ncbi:hypothetical protein [Nocardia sp. NPDC050435]|uniref:hypothetical protein n=1 Tax=Nocardia sp. NPDC050435 TaxID=3155040 RepID=UPI00340CF2D5